MNNPETGNSLLNQVRYSLALQEDIVVVGETVKTTPLGKHVETVRIFVRPDQDLGLDGNKLDGFQKQVFDPILRPTFWQSYKNRTSRRFYGGTSEVTTLDLVFGQYSFDEIIGRKKVVGRIELELYDGESKDHFAPGDYEEVTLKSEAATRAVEVYILPNDSIAKTVLAYEQGLDQGRVIPNETLNFLKHGLTAEQIRIIISGENPFPEISYKPSAANSQ